MLSVNLSGEEIDDLIGLLEQKQYDLYKQIYLIKKNGVFEEEEKISKIEGRKDRIRDFDGIIEKIHKTRSEIHKDKDEIPAIRVGRHPSDGACKFCWEETKPLAYSQEFDVQVHEDCVREEVKREEETPDAEIIAKELSILVEDDE